MTVRTIALAAGWLCMACSGPQAPTVTQARVRLDGAWSGQPWLDPEAVRSTVSITTTFELPEGDWGGSDLVLEGLWWKATVMVNGTELDAVTGGIAPVEVPVGASLHAGSNTIAISVAPPAGETMLELGGGLASSRFNQARAGLRVAPELELRPTAHLDGLAIVAGAGTAQGRATVEGAPEGSRVRFVVARDGEVIADLGQASITEGLATAQAVAWKGERWRFGEPDLVQLVATLEDPTGRVLDTSAVRTGVRQVEALKGGPAIEGSQARLLAARMTILTQAPPLADRIGLVLGGRPNAIEVHGEMVRSDWLEITDELGIPVVFIPRCVGRTRPESFPGRAPSETMWAQDERLVNAVLERPSVVMWATEGTPRRHNGPLSIPPLWTEALYQDPHQRPVVGKHYYGRTLQMRDGGSSCDGNRCNNAWIIEVARQGAESPASWSQMAAAFSRAVDEGAVGGAIPMPSPEGVFGWAEAWAGLAEQIGAPAWPQVDRRATSAVRISGLQPGVIAWLEAPGMAPRGVAAGADGSATITAWHKGSATLRVGEQTREVKLAPRTWKGTALTGEAVEVAW